MQPLDDILNALREITQLLQVTAGAQLVAQSQPVAQGSRREFRRGFDPPEPHRGSDPSASDVEAVDDDIDSRPPARSH